MSIASSANTGRLHFTATSGQTVFTVSFEFFDDADLNVFVNDVLKTITADYTVSGGDGSTGTVTFGSGLTLDDEVTIVRRIDIERVTDFVAGQAINRAALNTQLDTLTAIAADNEDRAGRGVRASDSENAPTLTIPSLSTRKGRVLGFNATTGAMENGPTIADVQSLAAITTDIGTLADIEDGTDATDAIQSVAAIASNVTTVAGISSNVTSVAGNASNINTVAADGTDIGTVAGAISNVNTVAGISSNVTTVAGISSDITTVAADATDIGNVASSIANVNLVASSLNSGALTAVNDYGSVANATVTTTDYGSV